MNDVINEAHLQKIKNYYDQSQFLYNIFWTDKESLGMHYGFHEKDTPSHSQALINQYRAVKTYLNPSRDEKILDAGCGIGEASIWLGQRSEANYVGIALSPSHIKQAVQNAYDRKLEKRVAFLKADFFNMPFGDGFFDKIFCIESACYAYPNPELLYKELYRVLQPKGKLLISDGVLLRKPSTLQEKEILEDLYQAWALAGGNTVDEIKEALLQSGLKNVEFRDRTSQIGPSVKKIYELSKLYPVIWALYKIKLLSKVQFANIIACKNQKLLYDAGILGYGIFTAEKL